MSDIKKLIGLRIKELRKHLGLSQEALAELANLDPTTLSNIENGKNYPSAETIEKLSIAFKIQPYQLFVFEHLQSFPTDKMIKELNEAFKEDANLVKVIYTVFKNIKN